MATRKEFSLTMQERKRRRFSENFKKEKVRQIERGQLKRSEVIKLYEVSSAAITKWMKKYGSKVQTERLVVESESDSRLLLVLKEKIADLERLVGQKQIEVEFYKKLIDLAEEQYGFEIKKNNSTQHSGNSGSKEKKTPSA